jgi:hypothetical protein
LEARLAAREEQLAKERKLAIAPPVVVGGILVIPQGMLDQRRGVEPDPRIHDTERSDRLAVAAVLATETRLGRSPREMPHNNPGFDIESKKPDGTLLHIEVKGRVVGGTEFTVTTTELNTGKNAADKYVLAQVEVADDDTTTVRYQYDPFRDRGDPGPFDTSVRMDWRKSWDAGHEPR